MAENIGTAYLNIEVRTDNMQAGLSTAKRSVSDMSQQAQAEYNKLTAAQKRVADSALNYAKTIGLAREEVRALNVEQRVGGQLGKELAATIRAQAVAQQAATAGMAASVRQTQAALRGVPAQITDIVTSLQGGQAPLTVLLQQGGQLKDMFGGIRPAAAALGSTLAGIVNPVTLIGAAVAGAALAWEKGGDEAEAYSRALVLTGNYAGRTADQMALLAMEMDNLAGVTQGSAAEALAAVAASGQFAGEQFEMVAVAAEQMRAATGKAIEETIAEFAKLRKDPVAALLDLNDKYHFLSQAQLEHIENLIDEGRHQEAVTEGMRIYAGVVNERSTDVVKNLGSIERAWRDIKNVARDALDAVLNIGRPEQIQRIAALQSNIRGLREGRGFYRGVSQANRDRLIKNFETEIAQIRQQIAGASAAARGGSPVVESEEARKRRKQREEDERSWGSLVQSNLTKQQRLEAELNEIRERGARLLGKKVEGELVTQATIDRQLAAARARFAESQAKSGRRTGKSDAQREAEQAARAADSLLDRIRQQVALNEEQSRSTDRLTTSERLEVAAKRDLAKLGGTVSASRRQEIEAAIEQLRVSGQLIETQEKQKKLAEDLARANAEVALAQLNQTRANAAEVAGLVLGRKALDQATRRLAIEREFEDKVAELRKQGLAETSESYREQVAIYARSRDEMLAVEEQHQRKLDELRGDWRNGARTALQDYSDAARDIAGQTNEIVGNAFSGLEDTMVEFLTKGKADWKGFFDSIAADFTRMMVRQQLAKLAEKFLPGLGGGSEAQALSASAAQLAASAAPLYGAAAALSASAAALAAAGAAGAGGGAAGSTGGGWGSLLTSIFSSASGRANGGPVSAGSLYQVGELNRPELLHVRGKQYLIPGDQGRVQPIGSAPGQSFAQVVNVTIQGRPDRSTPDQIAGKVGRETTRAMTRNR